MEKGKKYSFKKAPSQMCLDQYFWVKNAANEKEGALQGTKKNKRIAAIRLYNCLL